jgi:vitamin K-dependent gamma-carboxylase
VRADVAVSLNGRPAQRLIDPAIDLAAERFSLAPFRWILPAPDTDPP